MSTSEQGRKIVYETVKERFKDFPNLDIKTVSVGNKYQVIITSTFDVNAIPMPKDVHNFLFVK